jgi:hypothetical protein
MERNLLARENLKRDLQFLKGYISTLYAVQLLEYHDSTFLRSDPSARAKEQLELFKATLKKIDDIQSKVGD